MSKYELDQQLLQYLPPWYREILDYQEMYKAAQAQFDALAAEIIGVADNFFFQTMGADAVEQWEEIFRILPDTNRETLEFRRARVLNRISMHPPFTLGFLYQKLDELIGPGEWQVRVDYPNYTLYIESSAQNQNWAYEVALTINKIKPAHIVFVNTPYLSDGLLLSETIGLSKLVYRYRLGSWGLGVDPFAIEVPTPEYYYKLGMWELGKFPFRGEITQEVVKMPQEPSIQPLLLADTAGFVSGDIASARLNGTQVVTALTKTVVDSTLTVEYEVGPSTVSEITKIELLDAAGDALTAATVYIPVTTITKLKHTIPVKEGVESNG